MKSSVPLLLIGWAPGFLLTSCSVGPDYQPPDLAPPAAYHQPTADGASIANLAWWDLFQDPVLRDLIRGALENNRDRRAALARMEEARANLGIVRAALYPQIDYTGGGSVDKTVTEGGHSTTRKGVTGGLAITYEVDLWRRVRRSSEAALQQWLATEEAYRGITITLVAQVAGAYFLLRDLDNRLLIAQRTAETRRKSLDIMTVRQQAGLINEVDLNQSKIQLAEAEAAITSFERLRDQTENVINLLLSRPPQAIVRGATLTQQCFPPHVPVGLPSELLQRRPDLREAERQLHAQTERIGMAEALKYPQLVLTADAGANYYDSLASAFAGLAAQILGPIYHAGATRRQVEAEVARTQQLLNHYEQAFYTALREVEDALVAVRTYDEEYKARARQVEAAQSALKMAWVRYDGGKTSYLEVLDLERALFSSELSASEALQLRFTSLVQLYQALGGGWTPASEGHDDPGTDLPARPAG